MERERLYALAGSVVVHLVLLGILVLTLWERPEPPQVAASKPIIQARAVDEETALAPVRRREAEERRQREEAERQRQAAEEQKRREVEEARKKAEAEKRRQAEIKRKRLEAEKTRQAEVARKKAEAEKKRQAEIKRKQEEEQKRLAEAKRKEEEAERRRREEADRKRREEALQQQLVQEAERLAEEERLQAAKAHAGYIEQYKSAITDKVQRNWSRPPGMKQDFACKVEVRQIPGGEVVGVRILDSCGDMVLDRSVEAAVWKASPLPKPPVQEVFDREVVITFVPR